MDQNGMTNDSIAQKSRLVWTKYTSKNVFCYSHDVYPMSNSFMTVEYLDSWKTQLWRNFEESDHSVDQMEQAGLVGFCEGGGSAAIGNSSDSQDILDLRRSHRKKEGSSA